MSSSNARKARVLIVDDSVVARRLLAEVLGDDPDIEVVGTAASGAIALGKLQLVRPDVIVLDVEMPEMTGLELLPLIRKAQPDARIIMYSSLTARGAAATLDALALGASDYVTKPANTTGLNESRLRIKNELSSKIKALYRLSVSQTIEIPVTLSARPSLRATSSGGGRIDIVAIGASTGGPNALVDVLTAIDPGFPVPIAVVQHMPPVFTRLLAERIASRNGGRAVEVEDGARLRAGHIYVAPGDHHLSVERDTVSLVARVRQTPPENYCRPAVDVLFRSVAATVGAHGLAVMLTGMGHDGFRGCQDLKAAGGTIFAQDKATSVVWGMPGMVVNAGIADEILPLAHIGPRLCARTAGQRTGRSASLPRWEGHAG